MSLFKFLSVDFIHYIKEREEFYEKVGKDAFSYKVVLNFFLLLLLFSSIYGFVMGSYNSLSQAISSSIKMPILFSASIMICFPAFFIIQLILGSKLNLRQILTIVLAGFVFSATIMVAFSPIILFFTQTSDNYSFLKLLHVGVIGFSGFFGMQTMTHALQDACENKKVYPKIGISVFSVWVLVLAFVGMQLAWNLRPFLGNRDQPFEIIRAKQGNFYIAIMQSVSGVMIND